MTDRLIDLTKGSEVAEIVVGRSPRWIRASIYLLASLFIAVLVWAYLGRVDTYIPGRGVVRPEGDIVKVQPLVGGRLQDVLVKEGKAVEKGDVLFRIDGKEVGAELEKILTRLESGRQQLSFLEKSREELLRQHELEATKGGIEIEQAEWEVKKAESSAKQAEALLIEAEAKLADAEAQYERAKGLLSDGDIPQVEYEQKDTARQVAAAVRNSAKATLTTSEHEVSLLGKSLDLKRKEVSVAEMERQIALEDSKRNIVALEHEIDELELDEKKIRKQLDDFEVTAPIPGVVTEVTNKSAGEVVQAGDTVALIAPKDADWIVEAYVFDRDAGPLREKIGHEVRLKFDAFPFRDYGTISGWLEKVSHDAVSHETLGTVFRVEIGMNSLTLRRGRREGKIELGMTASVEIPKEEERILSLLFREARERVSYD